MTKENKVSNTTSYKWLVNMHTFEMYTLSCISLGYLEKEYHSLYLHLVNCSGKLYIKFLK